MHKKFISLMLSLAMLFFPAFSANAAKEQTQHIKKSYSIQVKKIKTIKTKGNITSFHILNKAKKKIKSSSKKDKKGKYKIANSGTTSATVYSKSPNKITIKALKPGTESVVAISKKGKTEYKYTIKIKAKKVNVKKVSASCPGSVVEGNTIKISTKVSPSDATDKSLSFKSNNSGIATVNNSGIVKGIRRGTATITIASKSNPKIKTSVKVNVLPRTIAVSGVSVSGSSSVKVGSSIQLHSSVSPANATNKSLLYQSSNANIATVSSTGAVKGVRPGTVTISVTSRSNPKASAKLTVNVAPNTIAVTNIGISCKGSVYVGETTSLSTSVSPANATDKTLVYKSSDTGIATVNSEGVIKGINPGNATITVSAKSNSGVRSEVTIKVIKKSSEDSEDTVPVTGISLSGFSSLSVGQTEKYIATIKPANASNKGVIFTSSNASVATVDANGNVKGIKAGTTTISATAKGNSSAISRLTVTVVASDDDNDIPVSGIKISGYNSVKEGNSIQLTTEITPDNANNKKVSYTSSDSSIASVDQNGKVTGIKAGTVRITATSQSNPSVYVTKVITVTSDTVAVTGISISGYTKVYEGETEKITASVKPANATNKGIRFESSNPSIATVDTDGNVKGIKAGTAIISVIAKDNEDICTTLEFTVLKKNGGTSGDDTVGVTGISVSGRQTLDVGETSSVSVKIIPENASNKEVTFSSSDSTIVSVDSNGQMKGIKPGTATIFVTSKGNTSVSSSLQITVNEETPAVVPVDYLYVVNEKDSIKAGETSQIYATAFPSNATDKGILYSSDNESVATVNDDGLITGVSEGTAKITVASRDGAVKNIVTINILSNAGPSLNHESLSMKYEEEDILEVKNQGNKSFYWKWSGSNVIKATPIPGSAKMKIEAIGNGTATVKAVFFDDNFELVCNITVTGKEVHYNPSIPAEINVNVGEKVDIPISDLPDNVDTIKWSLPSQNAAELSYHEDRKCAYIKGLARGTTTLTLQIDDIILTTKINVLSDAQPELSSNSMRLRKGESDTVKLNNAPAGKISCKNDNALVVKAEGTEVPNVIKINALNVGTSILTITDSEGTEYKCTVVVYDDSGASDISITPETNTLNVGEKGTITINNFVSGTINISSDNSAVVSAKELVQNGNTYTYTAKSAGVAHIKFTIDGTVYQTTINVVDNSSSGQGGTEEPKPYLSESSKTLNIDSRFTLSMLDYGNNNDWNEVEIDDKSIVKATYIGDDYATFQGLKPGKTTVYLIRGDIKLPCEITVVRENEITFTEPKSSLKVGESTSFALNNLTYQDGFSYNIEQSYQKDHPDDDDIQIYTIENGTQRGSYNLKATHAGKLTVTITAKLPEGNKTFTKEIEITN